jgi:hypothetical protein
MNIPNVRYRLWAAVAGALLCWAAPADAQFRPRVVTEQPATGERYHVEGSTEFWNPTADLVVTSAGTGALAGLPGSQIDAKRDLGFLDKRLPQFELVLRPARSHKFRFQYIPIKYQRDSFQHPTTIDFNGQRYSVEVPVNSSLDWKAARFGYEFDFINKSRGFGGFIIEAKYTDVRVDIATPLLNPPAQFAHARAPIPALGGIARVYVVPRVSITGEVTGFKLPDNIEGRYAAHYVDVDVYGTVNATNNVGFKVGYRSLDLGYLIKQDTGAFTLKGLYFGIVARY